MSDAVLQATIRAYDEFTQQFQRYQQELRRTNQTQQQTTQGTEQLNRAHNNLLQTIGNLGALYAFKRGLEDVLSTGREFQLALKQSQAVVGDFSSTLRDSAMAYKGIHGPTEMARAFYELGSAGLTAQETIKATPDVLDFATAGLIEMNDAAYAVSSTVKSFGLEWSQTTEVVDAFTASMNSTAMKAEDFRMSMASVGAVGKLASQDFKEMIAAVAAMRDAGVRADDAGTSVKAALLALINPSKEAKDIMETLGISVYNSSGQMMQYHEIIGQLERALGPYNEQSRNLILTTIAGSDGVRALATGLNMGSAKLGEYVDQMGNAEGATKRMSGFMTDSFNGAMLKTNANLERMKILLFEDFATGAASMLGVLNTLIIGFNSLDENTRKLIELLIGSAGLVVALGMVTAALKTMGFTMATVTGPIRLTVMAVSALVGTLLTYKGVQEEANRKAEETAKQVGNLKDQYEQLQQKIKSNSSTQEENKQAQEKLKSVISEIGRIMPDVVSKWDMHGQAVELDTTRLNTNTEAQLRNARAKTQDSLSDVSRQLTEQGKLVADLQNNKQKFIDNFSAQARDQFLSSPDLTSPNGWQKDISSFTQAQKNAEAAWAKTISEAETKQRELSGEMARLNAMLYPDADEKLKRMTAPGSAPSGGGGDKMFLTGSGDGKSSNQTKAYVEALTEALSPYRAAVEDTTNSLGILSTQEQYLNQVMQSGKGTANDAIQLNRVRTEQYVRLSDQQAALAKEIGVEQQALVQLQQQYAQATKPEQAKELRQEIENLTRSIAQSGQAWWQAEQQKFTLLQQLKQEEQRRYDDAYQKATDLMRHQVNMAQLSTEKQIEYMEKLQRLEGLSQLQRWEIEEDLYRLRKQQLSEYLGELEDEYKDKLDAINEHTKASIKAIQDQIDALDEKGKDNEREEAARKHNEKLKELQDKRKYHELRTGVEHQKAIADIDKETAEEQRAWELQQQEWSIEDQKDSLKEKLDQVREEGEKEREELEEHYRRARQIAESGIMDVVAALAATEPDWMNTGKDLIDGLIRGLETGDFSSIQKKIDKIRDQVPDTDEPDIEDDDRGSGGGGGSEDKSNKLITSIGPGSYKRYGDTTAMASRTLASLLGLGGSVSWDQNTGKVTIGGRSFTPLANENGTTYVGIRQVAEGLGFKAEWDDPYVNIYKAAQGAFAMPKPGGHFFNVAEAGEAELIAPLSKFQPMMNEAVAFAMAKQGGGVIININAPLLHVDSISDEVDVEMVSNKQRKMLTEIAFSRGTW